MAKRSKRQVPGWPSWLIDEGLDVNVSEYGRTGFQGGLQGCRRGGDARYNAELLTFSGRTIDVPSMFIAGRSDWGVCQAPGAALKMQWEACTKMLGFHLVDGAGHWVQQERSNAGVTTTRLPRSFRQPVPKPVHWLAVQKQLE